MQLTLGLVPTRIADGGSSNVNNLGKNAARAGARLSRGLTSADPHGRGRVIVALPAEAGRCDDHRNDEDQRETWGGDHVVRNDGDRDDDRYLQATPVC